jgi:16S rRNA (guanine966-N2)-methyltransferase
MSGHPRGVVRIVAGARRGRRLKVPSAGEVRPTSEKVREAIFDVLGPVGDLDVLDLFAGTGAMGLEALSRGARSCVFVEQDSGAAGVLRSNIAALGYERVCRVVVSDYQQALRRLVQIETRFDLLFVDPPYRILAEVEVTLKPLVSSLLSDSGVTVIEGDRSSRATLDQTPLFERVYGDTRVTMIGMRRSIP